MRIKKVAQQTNMKVRNLSMNLTSRASSTITHEALE